MPLMAKMQSPSRGSRIKHYLNAQIDTRRADIILIICFFISGLTDAGAYNAWRVFLSMQVSHVVTPYFLLVEMKDHLSMEGKVAKFV